MQSCYELFRDCLKLLVITRRWQFSLIPLINLLFMTHSSDCNILSYPFHVLSLSYPISATIDSSADLSDLTCQLHYQFFVMSFNSKQNWFLVAKTGVVLGKFQWHTSDQLTRGNSLRGNRLVQEWCEHYIFLKNNSWYW